jgi:hypothetical protein|tara:strand:+ start:193 stop:333 length:141 start_codon:yes stop_codon:yes gene_type:complete
MYNACERRLAPNQIAATDIIKRVAKGDEKAFDALLNISLIAIFFSY